MKIISKPVLIWAMLAVFPAPALASVPEFTITLPWQGQAQFSFELGGGARVDLSFKERVLSADFESGDGAVLVFDFNEDKDETYIYREFNLTTGDYNFDGFTDFAVVSSHGYGGVNVFSDVFLFDKTAGNFVRSLWDISNIELDAGKKELATTMKSGTRYYSQIYRFKRHKPWISSEWTWFAGGVELHIKRNPNGKEFKREIIDVSIEKQGPAFRNIKAEKAYLYDSANKTSRTKKYLVRDDKVRILDFRETAKGDWVQVRFDGKRQIEKWLVFSDVNWDTESQ